MSICWYCHWGWSKPVAELYKKHANAFNGDFIPLHFGPAHIVWEDENFDTESIQWCLDNFDLYKGDYSENELAIVRQSLEEMLKLPEEIRCVEPDDYDHENPDKYPPKVEMEKIR
ncbi:MAG: hypothetical protein WC998_01345 [Candidatus Paceibacterota bacterium]|jgi:hypothetical protein